MRRRKSVWSASRHHDCARPRLIHSPAPSHHWLRQSAETAADSARLSSDKPEEALYGWKYACAAGDGERDAVRSRRGYAGHLRKRKAQELMDVGKDYHIQLGTEVVKFRRRNALNFMRQQRMRGRGYEGSHDGHNAPQEFKRSIEDVDIFAMACSVA